jgi:hypothetical protein
MDELNEQIVIDMLSIAMWELGSPKINPNETETHITILDLDKYQDKNIKLEIYRGLNDNTITIETTLC